MSADENVWRFSGLPSEPTPEPEPGSGEDLEDLSERVALGKQLGQGGTATVYQGEFDGRPVALKLLDPDLAQGKGLVRFVREAEFVSRLEHPGLSRVLAVGRLGAQPCLVSELAEGGSLEDQWPNLNREQRLALLREVIDAVAAVHEAGIVHRDLKPQNVLLDSAGHARLTDFGVGWAANLERLTLTGALVGTPVYMAPEQATGRNTEVGPASDVWALGVILYQALTDRLPFLAESLAQQVILITEGRPQAPSSLAPDVSPELEAVCLRALATRASDRYPDARAMQEALDAVLGEPLGERNGIVRGWPWLVGLGLAALTAFAARPQTPPLPDPAAALPLPANAVEQLTLDEDERPRIEQALHHHMRAFQRGDLDEVMQSWHPKHPKRGALREHQRALLAEVSFRISDVEVSYLGSDGTQAFARSTHVAGGFSPSAPTAEPTVQRWRYEQIWTLRRLGSAWRVWDNLVLSKERVEDR